MPHFAAKEDQTERYLAALRNPSVHILGHPRGRIYNFRVGLKSGQLETHTTPFA
jgi:hypothetical protein